MPLVQRKAQSVGMAVPHIITYNSERINGEDFIWVVEEFVDGTEFFPELFDDTSRQKISADVGRQLRCLHTIEVNGFWSLSDDLIRAKYATWNKWVDNQEENIVPAVEIAGIKAIEISKIRAVYQQLRQSYKGSARLCHGDFSGDNLLVKNGHLVAAVDWENAIACDPAYDVAYWYRWHSNLQWLDSLLSGYMPENIAAFRRRVIFHSILQALDFIVWYSEEQNDQEGVEDSLATLRINLNNLS